MGKLVAMCRYHPWFLECVHVCKKKETVKIVQKPKENHRVTAYLTSFT